MDQSSFESWIEFRNFHRRIADSIFKLNKDQCFSISSIRSKLCFADQVVFDNCFLFFLFFLSSEKDCKLWRQALPDFRSECYRPNLKIIFCFLISLSVFIRFHKFTEFFKCFLFLLRYRGLSNTGFHVLQQLGMSPCVRLIPKVISSVRFIWTPQRPTHYVLWGDNLRRELKGRLPSLNREDHTVTGYVSLVNPLPFINDRYSGSANIVDGKYLDQILMGAWRQYTPQKFAIFENFSKTADLLASFRLNLKLPWRRPIPRTLIMNLSKKPCFRNLK